MHYLKHLILLVTLFLIFLSCGKEPQSQRVKLPLPEADQFLDSLAVETSLNSKERKTVLLNRFNQLDSSQAHAAVINTGLAIYQAYDGFAADTVLLDVIKRTGVSYTRIGGLKDAHSTTLAGINICKNFVDLSPRLCADLYFNSGLLYGVDSRWGEADEALEFARQIVQQKLPEDEAIYCALLAAKGRFTEGMEDWGTAAKEIREALQCLENSPEPNEDIIAGQYASLSKTLTQLGKTDEARSVAQIGINRLKEANVGCNDGLILIYDAEGLNEMAAKKYDESVAAYSKALANISCSNFLKSNDSSSIYSNIGVSLTAAGRYAESAVFYQKSIDVLRGKVFRAGASGPYLTSLFGLAQCAEQQVYSTRDDKDYRLAEEKFQFFVSELIEWRNRMLEEEGRVLLVDSYRIQLARTVEFYYNLYHQSDKLTDLAKAWFVADLAKSTYLYETIEGNRLKPELRAQIAQVGQEVIAATNPRDKLEAQSRLARLREELIDGLGLTQGIPQDYEAWYRQQLEGAIPEETTIVEFITGDDALLAFVFTDEGATLKLLGEYAPIAAAASDYLKEASTPEGDIRQLNELSRFFYDRLIAPLRLSDRKLVVAPEAALHQLPFALFTVPAGGRLADSYDISYNYSARIAARGFSNEATNKATTVLFTGIAPRFRDVTGKTVAVEDQFSVTSQRNGFSPLRYNVAEVVLLNELLGGQVLLDGAASPDNLFAAMAETRVMHIASHAGIDKSNLPYLVLAGKDEQSFKLLSSEDIATQPSSADLITLSVCGSADGKTGLTEAVSSLERSFYQSGGKAILSTYWQVDDLASSIFMEGFYSELKKGADKPAALKHAVSVLRQDPDYDHPFFWGAYRLVGEGGAIF